MGKYRGRHRVPVTPRRIVARVTAAVGVVVAPLTLAGQASAASWDAVKGAIEECESGGNNVPTSIPGPFTASGFWQITNPTWRDHGGLAFAPRALQASRAEQEIVAERLFNARGTQPWDASKGCWGPKVGRHASGQEAPRHAAPSRTPAQHAAAADSGGTYVVQPGDTLSGIATGHGTTWQRLYEINQDVIDSPHRIFPGERIRV